MSSIPHDLVAGGHPHGHDDHAHHPTGIMRWITTTNHKDIGTLYLWFSLTMFFVGGVMALTIRAELFQPGLQIVHPEFFNQLTTMHGLIMVFGAIMPAFVGFANWQIPMMIGAPALVGDKVVMGPRKAQIDVVLNGQNNGKMPAWRQLSDVDIASVISYTRNSWGNQAPENVVQPAEVKGERK